MFDIFTYDSNMTVFYKFYPIKPNVCLITKVCSITCNSSYRLVILHTVMKLFRIVLKLHKLKFYFHSFTSPFLLIADVQRGYE